MNALEHTLSTLRRAHVVLFLSALGLLVLSLPGGPDYDRAREELAALRSLVTDDVYGSLCAEVFLGEQTALWAGVARYAESRPGELQLPLTLPFGGSVDCNRPTAEDNLETYLSFLTEPQRFEFPLTSVAELYQGLQQLHDSPRAQGDLTHSQLDFRNVPAGSMKVVEFPNGIAPVNLIADLPLDTRRALSEGRDSLILSAAFRTGPRSTGSDVLVRGSTGTLERSSPLNWALTQDQFSVLGQMTDGGPAALPGLQPFWDAIRSYSLPEAVRYVQGLADQEGVRVEVLGIEVGVSTLALGGPLLLLAIMVHFAVHVRHLGRLARGDTSPLLDPWMPLFTDRLSVLATWCTVLLLPTAAAVLIGIRAVPESLPMSSWAFSVALALFLMGLSILRATHRLRALGVADSGDSA